MLKIQAAQHTFGPQACKINAQDSHTKYLYMFINTHLTTATHPRYIHTHARTHAHRQRSRMLHFKLKRYVLLPKHLDKETYLSPTRSDLLERCASSVAQQLQVLKCPSHQQIHSAQTHRQTQGTRRLQIHESCIHIPRNLNSVTKYYGSMLDNSRSFDALFREERKYTVSPFTSRGYIIAI